MRRRSVSGLCRPFNSVLFFVFFFINDDPLRVSLRSGLRRTHGLPARASYGLGFGVFQARVQHEGFGVLSSWASRK